MRGNVSFWLTAVEIILFRVVRYSDLAMGRRMCRSQRQRGVGREVDIHHSFANTIFLDGATFALPMKTTIARVQYSAAYPWHEGVRLHTEHFPSSSPHFRY